MNCLRAEEILKDAEGITQTSPESSRAAVTDPKSRFFASFSLFTGKWDQGEAPGAPPPPSPRPGRLGADLVENRGRAAPCIQGARSDLIEARAAVDSAASGRALYKGGGDGAAPRRGAAAVGPGGRLRPWGGFCCPKFAFSSP